MVEDLKSVESEASLIWKCNQLWHIFCLIVQRFNHMSIDVELETTLQHPQHILEEVSNDEILNVDEEISENEENESFDDEE
ncbi:hypothetical protein H5410_057493 [Solanum commersonii]|uniref:Uncharacterized protein n=1 Tax=Solanum commersonii TaxID=4109 RepID=A0A9J5WQ84_SOLCO|nr:hypothetical protein H5410_057493 [Solanum commersonii]